MSLRDGLKKMSKSDPSEYSRISLSDDADTIAQKVRKAKTDPEPLPTDKEGLKDRPEAENLIGIYAALNDSTAESRPAAIRRRAIFRVQTALADLAVAKLGPIGAEMRRLEADPAYIDSVLARRFAACARDRRADHESGQGHRGADPLIAG